MPKFCFWNLELRRAEKIIQDLRCPFYHLLHRRSIFIVDLYNLKIRAEETTWKEKNPAFNKSNVFSHIKVYQLESTDIINCPEAVNRDIISPNISMLSNNTKCSTKHLRTKELA